MSEEYVIVKKNELTKVADSIRSVEGSSEKLALKDFSSMIDEFADKVVEPPYIKETYDDNGNLIAVEMVGQTVVRNRLFYSCSTLTDISFPANLTSIEMYAFMDCTNLRLTSLPEGLKRVETSAFNGCTKLALTSLPEGLTSIGTYAFYNCTKLALTSLPEGLTSIKERGFARCSNLAISSLPARLTQIEDYAFNDCPKIITITFKRTPDLIGPNTFYYCNNLLNIYVPWSEGAVANAPWGATNATIHYDYTETEE